MTVALIKDTITPSLKRMQQALKELPLSAFNEWQKNTPVNTGNAKRKTKLRGNVIESQYSYAQKLDEGYSKKSPNGMSSPTHKFIERELKKIMRL